MYYSFTTLHPTSLPELLYSVLAWNRVQHEYENGIRQERIGAVQWYQEKSSPTRDGMHNKIANTISIFRGTYTSVPT